MTTTTTVVGLVVGLVAIVTAAWRLVRAVWAAGRRSQQLVGALQDNTRATEGLSGELAEHRRATAEKLAEHSERLTRLELRRRA